MKDPPPRVTSISLKHGATDALYIQSELEIMNPSDIQVNMGLVHFSLEFDGQIIGEIILQELKLDANTSNKMLTQGRLFADKPVPVVDYIGKYISGKSGIHVCVHNTCKENVLVVLTSMHTSPKRYTTHHFRTTSQCNFL